MEGCLERGVEYPGHDILRAYGVATAGKCQTLCAAHSGCAYFSHYGERRWCHLKRPEAVANRAVSERHVSGPARCQEYSAGAVLKKIFQFQLWNTQENQFVPHIRLL